MAEKSHVTRLIELNEEALLQRAIDRDEVEWRDVKTQVNVRLDAYSLFLIEKLAERYDHSRSSMARALLSSAAVDAWNAAGLPVSLEDEKLKGELLAFMAEHREAE